MSEGDPRPAKKAHHDNDDVTQELALQVALDAGEGMVYDQTYTDEADAPTVTRYQVDHFLKNCNKVSRETHRKYSSLKNRVQVRATPSRPSSISPIFVEG